MRELLKLGLTVLVGPARPTARPEPESACFNAEFDTARQTARHVPASDLQALAEEAPAGRSAARRRRRYDSPSDSAPASAWPQAHSPRKTRQTPPGRRPTP